MKVVVFDSGTLINLSMNGLLYVVSELKKATGVRFAITDEVKYETVERPLTVPRFELGALRVQEMLERKEIETPKDFGVSEGEIKSIRENLMHVANHSIKAKGKWIKIVSDAEISCLALSSILTKKGVKNVIAIDERTTRLLSEKPENLEKMMSKRMHQNVKLENENFSLFKEFRFIRSTELVYVAFKKGVLKLKSPKALEAALYATKFKGSSVSWDELKILKKL